MDLRAQNLEEQDQQSLISCSKEHPMKGRKRGGRENQREKEKIQAKKKAKKGLKLN